MSPSSPLSLALSQEGWAVVGIGVLAYLLSRPRSVSIPANVTVQAADTAGFRGYLKGSDSAAVSAAAGGSPATHRARGCPGRRRRRRS